MTMRRMMEFVLVVILMAAATWMIAWWAVPVVAAAWALARRNERWTPLLSGAAGMLGWLIVLLLPSSPGAVSRLADVAGAAMGTGAGPLVVLTLVFPALLGAASASFVRALAPAARVAPASAPRR